MQAVILVGGEGTRLRPLTRDLPKPMVPICGRPFIEFQLNLLKKYGVDEVIFSLGYKWQAFEDFFQDGGDREMKLHYVVEDSPLGTGGAIKNVEALLDGGTFLVFNGDILASFHLDAILDFHRQRKAAGTIALTPVDNPSIYGVVETDGSGAVSRFTEKPPPDQVRSNMINAGLYVLEARVLELMEGNRAYSVEREVFPRMLGEGIPLYAMAHSGYWLDIGSPKKYLSANHDVLSGRVEGIPVQGNGIFRGAGAVVEEGAVLEPPLWIGEGTEIGQGCRLIGPAVVGKGCRIGKGTIISGALLWDGVTTGQGCVLDGCILGRNCSLGDGAYAGSLAVLQSNSIIPCNGRVSPGETVESDSPAKTF